MASGYIHITRKDLIFDEENGVVYWKNGARFLGEIAKAVLNEGEENETVKYYLKSAVTKKAILIDAGVIVGGGLYYFVTDDANFINVRIETADFSSDGGGDGVAVTFLLPESKYYTVRYVEENGDIKLYDVDGDAGTLVPDTLPDVTDASAGDALVLDSDKKPTWDAIPDELPDTAAASAGDALVLDSDKKPVWVPPTSAKKYLHTIRIYKYNEWYIDFNFIDDSPTAYNKTTLYNNLPSTDMLCSAVGISGDHVYNACMAHKGSNANSITVSRYLDYNKADSTYSISAASITIYFTGTADTVGDSVTEI